MGRLLFPGSKNSGIDIERHGTADYQLWEIMMHRVNQEIVLMHHNDAGDSKQNTGIAVNPNIAHLLGLGRGGKTPPILW
jgi:hypothetical protein